MDQEEAQEVHQELETEYAENFEDVVLPPEMDKGISIVNILLNDNNCNIAIMQLFDRVSNNCRIPTSYIGTLKNENKQFNCN